MIGTSSMVCGLIIGWLDTVRYTVKIGGQFLVQANNGCLEILTDVKTYHQKALAGIEVE